MIRQAVVSCKPHISMLHQTRQSVACVPQHQQQRLHQRLIFTFAKGFGGFGFGAKAPEIGLSGRPTLKPGKVSPKSVVPLNIGKPPYADSGAFPKWDEKDQVHDPAVRGTD